MEQIQIRDAEGPSGVRILHLEGPLTLNTLFDFQDAVRKEQPHGLIIVLDGVSYMDSAGLGAILSTYASCQRHGRKFALANVSQRVLTLLQVSKVDGLISRFDSVESATRELAAGA